MSNMENNTYHPFKYISKRVHYNGTRCSMILTRIDTKGYNLYIRANKGDSIYYVNVRINDFGGEMIIYHEFGSALRFPIKFAIMSWLPNYVIHHIKEPITVRELNSQYIDTEKYFSYKICVGTYRTLKNERLILIEAIIKDKATGHKGVLHQFPRELLQLILFPWW